MKSSFHGLRTRAAGALAGAGAAFWSAAAWADETLGQPTDGAIDMQHGVSPLRAGSRTALGIIFHDAA